MDDGSHTHSRSLRRLGLVLVVMAMAMLLLSGGALAKDALFKEGFTDDDGKDPKKDRWVIEEEGVGN